jgi:K+-transporting ATPase ATPase A chain
MTTNDFVQIGFFLVILLLLVKPLGGYMANVFSDTPNRVTRFGGGVERLIYRLCGIRQDEDMGWKRYALALLIFNILGLLVVYALQRLQQWLPLNPQHFPAVTPGFGAEHRDQLCQQYQLAGLRRRVDDELPHPDAGSGGAELPVRRDRHRGAHCDHPRLQSAQLAQGMGNFWVDMTRSTLYVLLPLSLLLTMLLVSQGVVQNFKSYVDVPVVQTTTVQRAGAGRLGCRGQGQGRQSGDERRPTTQTLPMGPAASQIAGGNMEGKESASASSPPALFAVVTTAASCGAVNAMHDSFTPLGGMIPLINMQLGEIIVGGVGAGLYGMLLFVVLAIFVAGLMVGRTPEYLGKKIEAREVKMAMLAILVLPLMYLGWTAVAVVLPSAVASMANAGPHGFTEVLYAYTSATGNNGSAFGGLSGNTFFYNLTLGIAMFVGRFFMIVPAMAMAGSLAAKKSIPPSAGTLPTTGGCSSASSSASS